MNQQEQITRSGRIIYLDYLRIIAAWAVVIIHVAAQNWYSVDFTSMTWKVFHIYDSVLRWTIPVFIMVSGTIFLNKDCTPKTIFGKYVLRMVVAYLFWSLVYALHDGGNWKKILAHVISGNFHMWFVPMMIGIYICIPMLKKIVEDAHIARYYLMVTTVVLFVIPYVILLVKDFGSWELAEMIDRFSPHLEELQSSLLLGYPFYFILGYCLSKAEFTKKQRLIIYGLGLAGCGMTVIFTYLASLRVAFPVLQYYDEFTFNVLLESVAVFVFVRQLFQSKKTIGKLGAAMSKYCFGIFWVHALIIELVEEKLMLNTMSFNAVISVPLISVIVFTVSFAISWLIGKIPVVKRYLV